MCIIHLISFVVFVQVALRQYSTKSESSRPYIVLENGGQILLYKKNDNPFENNFFSSYEGKKVVMEGELVNGTFVVENIIQQITENSEVSETSEKTEIEEN